MTFAVGFRLLFGLLIATSQIAQIESSTSVASASTTTKPAATIAHTNSTAAANASTNITTSSPEPNTTTITSTSPTSSSPSNATSSTLTSTSTTSLPAMDSSATTTVTTASSTAFTTKTSGSNTAAVTASNTTAESHTSPISTISLALSTVGSESTLNATSMPAINTTSAEMSNISMSTVTTVSPVVETTLTSAAAPVPPVTSDSGVSSSTHSSSTTSPMTSTTSTTTASSSTTTASSKSSPTPIIVGVVVGVGGGLIVIGVLLFGFWYLRIRKDKGKGRYANTNGGYQGTPGPGLVHQDDLDSLHPFNPLPDQPVQIAAFLQYVADHQRQMKQYRDEFEKLPGPSVQTRKIAKSQKNEEWNRYVNIMPYDMNRVELQTDGNSNNYINASYIDAPHAERAFIATQGPLDKTAADFWQMIWQLKCTKIVMVTNVIENYKPKSIQYWPRDMRTTSTYGKFKVQMISENVNFDFTVRQLSIQKGDQPEHVAYHYHFTTWPDQGVPETCTALLKFHNVVFSDSSVASGQPDDAPVVVHCSAGVGRSGTLIAINVLLKQAEETGQIDIFKCIETLRLQRMFMVQTSTQYIFIHHLMLEALLLGDVTYPASNFVDEYQQLSQPIEPQNKSKLQLQFEVLDVLKPNYPEQFYSISKTPANVARNRSSAIRPADCSIVCLQPLNEDSNTYINAVYVNGYRKAQAPFIATQMPLATTAIDFWRLVQDNSSVAIIMLNDLENNNEEQYWPADGQSTVINKFTITNIGPELVANSIVSTNLRITYSGKIKKTRRSSTGSSDEETDSDTEVESDEKTEAVKANGVYANIDQLEMQPKGTSFVVRHMRVLNWVNDQSFPADKSTLLSLYSETVQCQQKDPKGRVIVHCLYGSERSGLFCALMNMMDELKAENQVDVYNAVKRVRLAQPEFVKNFDDYNYLYQLAVHYLSSTDNDNRMSSVLYSNLTGSQLDLQKPDHSML